MHLSIPKMVTGSKSLNPFVYCILNQIVVAAKVSDFPPLSVQPVCLTAAVGSYCPHINNNTLPRSFAANISARRSAEERRWAAIGITRSYLKPRFTEHLIHCDQTGCRKDDVRQSRWKTFWRYTTGGGGTRMEIACNHPGNEDSL